MLDHRPAPTLSRADAKAVALGLAATTVAWLLLRAVAAGIRAHPGLTVALVLLIAATGALRRLQPLQRRRLT
jgi:hypothetical protein